MHYFSAMKFRLIEVKWAAVFMLMGLLWMLLERATGLHDEHIDKHAIYTNLVTIPAILIYLLALLEKRKNDYHGFISYKQAFMSGLVITLLVTLLTPLSQWITLELITPHYFENAIAYGIKIGQDEKELLGYFNFNNYLLLSILAAPVMGLITSALVSLFVMKKPKLN